MPASGLAPRWASALCVEGAAACMQGVAACMQEHFHVSVGSLPLQACTTSTVCMGGLTVPFAGPLLSACQASRARMCMNAGLLET